MASERTEFWGASYTKCSYIIGLSNCSQFGRANSTLAWTVDSSAPRFFFHSLNFDLSDESQQNQMSQTYWWQSPNCFITSQNMTSSFIGVDGFALSHHVHNCNAKLENDWVFVRITKINHTAKGKTNLM